MIEIWPAIDIIDSQNVRLTEGDYGTKTAMGRTPLEAVEFYNRQPRVTRIHLVDLIGAKEKRPAEMDLFKKLIESTDRPAEIGGGIRSENTIRRYLDMGAGYLIIGTKGLTDPDWLMEMSLKYPGRLMLGLDARGDRIALNGWLETGEATIFETLDRLDGARLAGVIYTDIARDGRMEGPNIGMTGKLARASAWPVTASGGVRHARDLRALEEEGITAAIVGKAANTEEFWESL